MSDFCGFSVLSPDEEEEDVSRAFSTTFPPANPDWLTINFSLAIMPLLFYSQALCVCVIWNQAWKKNWKSFDLKAKQMQPSFVRITFHLALIADWGGGIIPVSIIAVFLLQFKVKIDMEKQLVIIDEVFEVSANVPFDWSKSYVRSVRVSDELFPPPDSVAGHLAGWLAGGTSSTTTQISCQNVTLVFVISSRTVTFYQSTSLTVVHVHHLQLQVCPRRRKGVLSPVFHILQSIW